MASTRRQRANLSRAPSRCKQRRKELQQQVKSSESRGAASLKVGNQANSLKFTATHKKPRNNSILTPTARRFRAAAETGNTQVVVGNGMVGQRLVELCADKLEERGASDQVDIVSFCEERLAAYNRETRSRK